MDKVVDMMLNEQEHYESAFIAGEKAGYKQVKELIVQNMKNENFDYQVISKIVNLSSDKF